MAARQYLESKGLVIRHGDVNNIILLYQKRKKFIFFTEDVLVGFLNTIKISENKYRILEAVLPDNRELSIEFTENVKNYIIKI